MLGVSRRRKRKKRWWDETDCCCIVGELFDGPCFVATAAHGDEAAEPVRVLRAYRDQRLARHYPGRVFTKAYYRYGRYGARVLRRFPVLKPAVGAALMPLVAYARRALKGVL
jgi:hypothetical protein